MGRLDDLLHGSRQGSGGLLAHGSLLNVETYRRPE
jgi:hypothetical protein